MHPRSSKVIINFINSNLPKNCYLLNKSPKFGNTDLIDAIINCEIFISWQSTSLHYSVLADKKTLIMDWYDIPYYGINYLDEHLIKIHSINNMTNVINKCLNNKNYKTSMNFINKINSRQLILNELIKIVNKND